MLSSNLSPIVPPPAFIGGLLAQAAADRRIELEWTHMPRGLGVFALIAVVAAGLYGVVFLYRRENAVCPPWAKTMLAALRSAVLLLLAVIFLGPSLIPIDSKTVHPLIVVLRDASSSMGIVDRWTDPAAAEAAARALGVKTEELATAAPSRARLVDRILSDPGATFLDDLRRKGRVKVVDFAQSRSVAASLPPASAREEEGRSTDGETAADTPKVPPLVAAGAGTDLAGAIREAVAGEPPAAVIVFSDGQSTVKADPREAAREAAARDAAVLFVGVGDTARPGDIRVSSVYARPQVWGEEPFEIEAFLGVQGMPAGELQVDLLESRVSETDGTRSTPVQVARTAATVPEGGGRVRAAFTHSAKEPGRYVYTVKVEPQEGERSPDDNSLDSQVVKVLQREKIRVLLIAGAPTWEYRMVAKLLCREENMVVSCWLQTLDEGRAQEGTRPIAQLPTTREELFWYDVVMLFDPNPREFDAAWFELLGEFARGHAGGVLYMPGPNFGGVFITSQRAKPLREMLPVRFGDVAAIEMVGLISTNSRAWPLKVGPAGVDHPVMSFFGDRSRTLKRWETLPGVFWSFPANAPKPTAQVLLEHGDPAMRGEEGPRPLMVSGRYGPAHVLYLGFNGTWRWRKAGNEAEFFDKFWIQAVRHLAESRALEGRRRGTLSTDRDRYEIGDRVTISARLQDVAYEPLVAEKIEGLLSAPDEPATSVTLLPTATQPGSYSGVFAARKVGSYTLRVKLPGGDDTTLETPFLIELPSVETAQTWLNTPLLDDLAALSGGRTFRIDQASTIAAAVPDRTQKVEIRGAATPLWDTQPVLLTLVGLLAAEWWIRKRFRLL
jgi:hypothetical protein